MSLVKEIEALEKLRQIGTLSQQEFKLAKTALLNQVPDAEETRPAPQLDQKIEMIFRGLCPPALATAVLWAIGLPASLALTVGATLLAAIVVAWHRLSDEPEAPPKAPQSESHTA